MKTVLNLCIQIQGTEGCNFLCKTFNCLIPCFTGMKISDVALNRNEDLLEVQSVVLCTAELLLQVNLKPYIGDAGNSHQSVIEMFKSHGWTSPASDLS